MIYTILHIFFLILFIYLAINILYLLIMAIAGRTRKHPSYSIHPYKNKIAVLITSYKEDEVIINTAHAASNHNYPKENFHVFLSADHLKKSTLQDLSKLNITLHKAEFPIGSKARSLNLLLNSIDENKYDIAVILDADNIMMPGFLEKINTAFQRGYKAVQGHRTAKNLNSPVAVLDAVSEEINNHLFRNAQRAFHLSSSLIGSGMAFEFRTLKKIYNKPGILDNPACDREVDFEMMKQGIDVEYIEDAMVLDEKVSRQEVYEKQRRRWLESQALHLRLFFSKQERIPHKTKNFWNKLFINLLPPRLIFVTILIFLFIVCLAQIFSNVNITGIGVTWWAILILAYLTAMVLSIPKTFMNTSTAKSFIHLPSLLFSFLKAAVTMRPNRKEFVHTPKSFTGTINKNQ